MSYPELSDGNERMSYVPKRMTSRSRIRPKLNELRLDQRN